MAVGRRNHSRLVGVAGNLRDSDGDAARERPVALAAQQALAGKVHGHERRRAGRLHRHALAAEVQLVGDAGGEEVLLVADQDLHEPRAVDAEQLVEPGEHVAVAVGAGIDRYGAGQ